MYYSLVHSDYDQRDSRGRSLFYEKFDWYLNSFLTFSYIFSLATNLLCSLPSLLLSIMGLATRSSVRTFAASGGGSSRGAFTFVTSTVFFITSS